MKQLKCNECKKSFFKKRKTGLDPKYCSRQCYADSMRKKVETTGVKYIVIPTGAYSWGPFLASLAFVLAVIGLLYYL